MQCPLTFGRCVDRLCTSTPFAPIAERLFRIASAKERSPAPREPAGVLVVIVSGADDYIMLQRFIDVLYPPSSLTNKAGQWMTPSEREALRAHPVRLEGVTLIRRGLSAVDRLVAADSYGSSPLLREAIRRFKYRRVTAYTADLSRMLAMASHMLPSWPDPVLCPVPLHWTRQFFRGFNQAAILAESVRLERGWKVQTLLKRTRATGSQARRSIAERRRAMAHAFAWIGGTVPRRVILIDDVVTSGATLDACACALKEAGVSQVDALTLAVASA